MMAIGTPSIARTTSAMPQGLTRGAVARALRSAFDVGAQEAARTTACRPRATETSDIAVHTMDGATMAMASAQAADAWQATAPIITVAERRSAAVEPVRMVPAPPSTTAA